MTSEVHEGAWLVEPHAQNDRNLHLNLQGMPASLDRPNREHAEQ